MQQYKSKKYLTVQRLHAYLEQFRLITGNDIKILEIGKGAGIFKNMTTAAGYKYISIDHDINTSPEIVSDVTNLSVKDKSFDYVYCCQVLEHLPFDKLRQSISELSRIAKMKVIISLPDNRKHFRFHLKMPKLDFRKVFSIPKTGKNIAVEPQSQHFWEIGDSRFRNCVSENEILNLLHKSPDIKNISHYRFFERPYQHFFVLTNERKS